MIAKSHDEDSLDARLKRRIRECFRELAWQKWKADRYINERMQYTYLLIVHRVVAVGVRWI